MTFGWENLNRRHRYWTDADGRSIDNKGLPTEGRLWLRAADRAGTGCGGRAFRAEWHMFKADCGICFGAKREGEGDQLSFSVAVPLLGSFWFTLIGFRLVRRAVAALLPSAGNYGDHRRELRLSVHDWALWWSVWRDPWGGWSRDVPWWREGNIQIADVLLGEPAYSERDLRREEVLVPMPERAYVGEARLFESTWKRPRWIRRRMVRARVDMTSDPIPHPGKGENSYDCGEDATFSTTVPVDTIEKAVAATVEGVMTSRRQHGGRDWRPGGRDWRPAARQ